MLCGLSIILFSYFVGRVNNFCSRNQYRLNPPIRERKLIFHPNNTIFAELMKDVSDNLKLVSPVGVTDESQLESIFVKDQLIAAVQFHHSPVSRFVSTI